MKALIAIVFLAATLSGCASPQRITQGAEAHQQRAVILEQRGDYLGAASERAAAQKQYEKAAHRQAYLDTAGW
jgi:hypothetical protein